MGRCDEPLNNNGISQAIETKTNLLNKDIDLIICSPLLRAKQTAIIINEDRNIPIIYDDRIIRFVPELSISNLKIINTTNECHI